MGSDRGIFTSPQDTEKKRQPPSFKPEPTAALAAVSAPGIGDVPGMYTTVGF